MSHTTRVAEALDEQLSGLPTVPAEHYLAAGRLAQRSRRRRRSGAAAGLVAAAAVVVTQVLPVGAGSHVVQEHRPATLATGGTVQPASLSSLQIEAGIGHIDSFTTDEIPEWAKEYGNHGPAAIAPDGRLWVAPETAVVRSIVDPVGPEGRAGGVRFSYAIEVRWEQPDAAPKLETDGLVWWFGYQDEDSTGTFGSMDEADRWTSDFALWAENEAASLLGRPTFANQLVRFENDRSKVLTPLSGVEVVDQMTDVDTGDREQFARRTAAEVVIDGQTYFVLASGRRVGHAFYEPFQAGVVAPDLAGFLRYVAS